ncbi:MAG: hypothetical protein AB7Q97_12765 [Gammaproteobacteria bacterium]
MSTTATALPSFASIAPPPLLRTWNKRDPASVIRMRAADLPGMTALPVRALMPKLPAPIWAADPAFGPTGVEAVRERTRAVVARMDWSRIGRGKRVHLLANPHGFFLSGEAYVVMLEEIAAHVRSTRGADVRLRIAESMGHIENPDWMRIHDLPGRFGNAKECPQIGKGVKADTRLGPFWLTHELFAGDFFIHTHVTEMREGYLHRMLDRLYKPFGMAYTRVEARSAYHTGFGPRTGQLVSRAVFESEFIQQRYAGTVVLDTTSEGVIGVDGDFDLDALDRRLAGNVLRNYGTLIRLLGEIDQCTVIFDGHGTTIYTYAGGIAFDNLFCADTDFLDLDNLSLMAAASVRKRSEPGLTMGHNPAIKCIVLNYMAGGVPTTSLLQEYPTLVVGEQMYRWMINDPSNTYLAQCTAQTPDLPTAMRVARNIAGTDQVIAFDRTPGALRVSESLARRLLERAPAVAEDVEKNRLPKWLSQRGLA